ncbi:MAG: DUF58 domain-containing protein [Deltaproteobacteria bacterium]|nr:DUF58 domain-containing protein [Deltaproteobacteria bacterium]MCW5805298.1 DUF58 domain-containing protein [Deltaproteobacteria bacterium]
MIPRLATRGKLVLGTALLFMVVGALHGAPPLVALSGVVLTVLLALYLGFYPTAILLRRKKIELSWWVPPGDQPGGALSADRPFQLHLAFRNHGSRKLRILSSNILAASALDISERPSATVKRGMQVEVTTTIKPLTAGYQVLHGAALTFGDALGLFDIEAYFPNPIAVKVFPRTVPLRGAPVRAVGGALHEQVGLHHVRRRGLSGELREIREHSHGDPFKFIAWKATARKGRLMVRDLENEIVTTHVVMLDVGASMRSGGIGRTPLDWASDSAAALAKAAINNSDRIGLVGYDTRAVAELGADTGHHHYLQLVDKLLDLRSLVDEDLTDVTAGELVALVARYLAHQEAIDVRIKVAPPLDDPRWTSIQAGPDGQLYDVAATGRLCKRLIDAMIGRDGNAPKNGADKRARQLPVVDSDAALTPLRQFCRLRGIELPYRAAWEHGKRSAGFAAAVERAVANGRPDVAVIVSDLVGLAEDEPRAIKALARLRKASGRVVALVPSPAQFLPAVTHEHAARVRELMVRDARGVMEPGRRLLTRHGITVVEGSPFESLDRLMGGGRIRRAG